MLSDTMKSYDYLIVGSGLFGATFAYLAAKADREENVIFGGRLAEYKYYDMAPVIERAMELFRADERQEVSRK